MVGCIRLALEERALFFSHKWAISISEIAPYINAIYHTDYQHPV